MTILARELDRIITEDPLVGDNGEICASLCLYDDFVGFSGHFPGYPLLPAFMQVSLARHVLEKALGKKLTLLSIKNAKFTAQAKPGNTLSLICTPCDPGTAWDCRVSARQGAENFQVSKFRMQCGQEEWQP